jgi:tRNA G18 (ribose-2'-O)-methylase SpoU
LTRFRLDMGTIVRTAAASPNIDAVLLLENCCSIQNPIVQFASCGVSLKAKFIYAPITKKRDTSPESVGKDSSAALTQLKNDGASVRSSDFLHRR